MCRFSSFFLINPARHKLRQCFVRLNTAHVSDVALNGNIADTRYSCPARHKLRLCFVRLITAHVSDVALNV